MISKGRLKLLLSFIVLATLFASLSGSPIQKIENEDSQITKDQTEQLSLLGVFDEETAVTDPPAGIECAYYNHDECISDGKCEITKEVCYPESHLKGAGCYAVFNYPPQDFEIENSTEVFIPVNKSQYYRLGCIAYQDTELMGCTNDTVCRQSATVRMVGHCCCSTPNCNADGLEQYNPDLNKDSSSSDIWDAAASGDISSLERLPVYAFVMIVLAFVFCAGFCFILIAVYLWKQKNNQLPNVSPTKECPENAKLIEMEDVPPPRDPYSDFIQINQGDFSDVFKAKYTSDSGEEKYVAIKKLRAQQWKNFNLERAAFEELRTCSWYAGIVGFIAAEERYIEVDENGTKARFPEYWIVTDFHERLSLFDLLRNYPISLSSCGRLLVSMLDGLQYLHDDRSYLSNAVKHPIIHRDIKSKNILVRSDMTACIADFGLARVWDDNIGNSDFKSQCGTKRYMAPEMIAGAIVFGEAGFKMADVYSMALVMWETISRTKLSHEDEVPKYQIPYPEIGFNPSVHHMQVHVCQGKVRPAWRPEHSQNIHTSFYKSIAEDMWRDDSLGRITAGCAFAQIWDFTQKNPIRPGSLGYCTGNSSFDNLEAEENAEGVKEGSDSEEAAAQAVEAAEIVACMMVGTEKMSKYHGDYSLKHPTCDPELDDCPPVPAYPIIRTITIPDTNETKTEIFFPGTTAAAGEKICTEKGEEGTKQEEVFSIKHQRMFPKDEYLKIALREAIKAADEKTVSTLTPEHTFTSSALSSTPASSSHPFSNPASSLPSSSNPSSSSPPAP